jgi:hypothetical protein
MSCLAIGTQRYATYRRCAKQNCVAAERRGEAATASDCTRVTCRVELGGVVAGDARFRWHRKDAISQEPSSVFTHIISSIRLMVLLHTFRPRLTGVEQREDPPIGISA